MPVATKRTLSPKPVLDEDALLSAFSEVGVKPSHAHKIWRLMLQQNATSYDDIPELPKTARQVLDSEFAIMTSKVVSRTDAADGSTTKLLVELQDGQRIESVIMRYGDVLLDSFPDDEKKKLVDEEGNTSFKSKKRATLCVSSQVGCAMGCTFCATGTMGLLANLSAGEILEQLVHANRVEKIRNIVFMGMGEPLDNYTAVLAAIRAMVDTGRFGLSPSRISVSTVGVVPRIHALKRDAPEIGLALSLHAPTQELRTQIVPTAKAWPIERILEATDAFIANQNRTVKSYNRRKHVLVEYVLIADINDSPEVAHQLGRLLKGRDVLLNVIPYNPTAVPHDYHPPTAEATRVFVDIVRNTYGVHTLLRQELGQDISSACGQLVIDSNAGKGKCGGDGGGTKDAGVGDLEDLMGAGGEKIRGPVPTGSRNRKVAGNGKVHDLGNGEVGQKPEAATRRWDVGTADLVVKGSILALAIALVARVGWKFIKSRA
ncbi:sorting nexin [Borealophlyctis nickersoniae]|nr:sorting nexin [Borealophlyctis nickersoniae]